MTTLTAHFDGKVLVPDSPVKLPVNQPLKVSVSTLETDGEEDDDDQGERQGAARRKGDEHDAGDDAEHGRKQRPDEAGRVARL